MFKFIKYEIFFSVFIPKFIIKKNSLLKTTLTLLKVFVSLLHFKWHILLQNGIITNIVKLTKKLYDKIFTKKYYEKLQLSHVSEKFHITLLRHFVKMLFYRKKKQQWLRKF